MQASQVAKPIAIQEIRRVDRVIGVLAIVALVAIVTAVLRGHAQWGKIPLAVWAHLLTITLAVGLTPVMMWRRRGDRRHRRLGYLWVSAMALTALFSLGIRAINPGHFSSVHLLAIWTFIQLPLIVLRARQHDHRRHAQAVRGMAIGALLVAGFFTFTFHRLLAQWLYGG